MFHRRIIAVSSPCSSIREGPVSFSGGLLLTVDNWNLLSGAPSHGGDERR